MTPSQAEWKCAGCGAPGLERSCDCVTDVVCLVTPTTHEHAVKIEPPRLSLPPCMMPDGGEACAAFHQQAKEVARLRDALERSVVLQSHYADCLNMYDGGHRMQFKSADAWLARLAELGKGPQ